MNNALMFSSKSDEWATPQDFFDALSHEFGGFGVDLAASAENAKVSRFYSLEDDALAHDWHREFEIGWLNPPYSRGLCGKFIAKAADERRKGFLTVMLLPARTDTKAFHGHIYDASKWQAREGVEIRLLPGRLKFGGAPSSAPFPSMVVVFRP
jgi:site-specific DNA-methyltransferase (adenine-specific)